LVLRFVRLILYFFPRELWYAWFCGFIWLLLLSAESLQALLFEFIEFDLWSFGLGFDAMFFSPAPLRDKDRMFEGG